MIFGMPQEFHYGNGHGTNPILIMQAIAANIIRHRRVMNDNCGDLLFHLQRLFPR